MQKMAKLNVPDYVYNWLMNFFSDGAHDMEYLGNKSDFIKMTANIYKGRAWGRQLLWSMRLILEQLPWAMNCANMQTIPILSFLQ